MHPIIYDFGPFSIKSYGLMLAIAFFVGIYLAKREAKKAGMDGNFVDSLSFGIIISAIIGARLLHVIAEQPGYYLKHPLDIILKINYGGLAFYGGFIFAAGFSIWYCVTRKLNFWKVADVLSPSIAIGLMFARMGCFLAGCCYGKECALPWAVTFTNPLGAGEIGTRIHPTQIYESFVGFIMFIVLITVRRYKRFDGMLFAILLGMYSIARPILEIYRADNRGGIGIFSTSQLISIPIFIFAVVVFVMRWNKGSGKKA